jgi:hypothetical protein
MDKYILVVHSNATAGNDDAYNKWYDDIHLGEVLQITGFTAAQRFKVTGAPAAGGPPTHQYLAIYELETDTPQVSLDGLGKAVSSGKMTMSGAIDMTNTAASLYGPITARVTK